MFRTILAGIATLWFFTYFGTLGSNDDVVTLGAPVSLIEFDPPATHRKTIGFHARPAGTTIGGGEVTASRWAEPGSAIMLSAPGDPFLMPEPSWPELMRTAETVAAELQVKP